MSFFDERLDPRISINQTGGPVFSSEVKLTVGGQRYANRNWVFPLHRYNISQGIKKPADFEIVRSMFYNVYGQFDGFRYKDWFDFEAVSQPLALVSGSVYQLQRAYVRGARTFLRTISKPVAGLVAVLRTRPGSGTSLITPTIDYTTGRVTVTGHVSGDTYTWTGEFDVPVAFTSDVMEAEIVDKKPTGELLVRWPSIQLQEIRL